MRKGITLGNDGSIHVIQSTARRVSSVRLSRLAQSQARVRGEGIANAKKLLAQRNRSRQQVQTVPPRMRPCNQQLAEFQSHGRGNRMFRLHDVFEHKVALTIEGKSRIEQHRDMRMREPSENATFHRETLVGVRIGQDNAQHLDRCSPLMQSVATTRQPDLPHATGTERTFQFPIAHALAGAFIGVHVRRRQLARGAFESWLAPALPAQATGKQRVRVANRFRLRALTVY